MRVTVNWRYGNDEVRDDVRSAQVYTVEHVRANEQLPVAYEDIDTDRLLNEFIPIVRLYSSDGEYEDFEQGEIVEASA